MFSDILAISTNRLTQIRNYLNILDRSIPPLPQQPTDYDNTCKGLFFVYIYGVYEYTIHSTVVQTIECINNSNKNMLDMKNILMCLSLNDEYNSIASVGANKRWEKRWELLNKIEANEKVCISTDIMPTDGKNFQHRQLESIWTSFGITTPIYPRESTGGRIKEIVGFRNDIAHGDKSPLEIGRTFTLMDLFIRFNDINEYCSYIVDTFENYINNQEYLRP